MLKNIRVLSFYQRKKKKAKILILSGSFFALGGTLFSGLVGVIQKIFASDFTSYKLSGFLNLSFVFIITFDLAVWVILQFVDQKKKQKEEEENAQKENLIKGQILKTLVFTAILGICMGLVNKMNTYLSGKLPSIIVFPMLNGGGILLTTLLSVFLFKEKLTKKQALGVIVGVLSIIFISVGQTV